MLKEGRKRERFLPSFQYVRAKLITLHHIIRISIRHSEPGLDLNPMQPEELGTIRGILR
jgi:hypothetical protein